ncbi:MAG: 4Fe-4S single cluster domain-containing protein, partial [Carnobacterium sp.]
MKNPKPQEWLAQDFSRMKVADYKPFNFVDGEGVRCSLYVSGCLFACKGCYNKIAQNFDYGQLYTTALEDQIMADLSQTYVQGLTLLGGEPFLNTGITVPLAKRVKEEF